MAKAKNKVIAGHLNGADITTFLGDIQISCFNGNAFINKNTVANIEVVTSETKRDTGSTIARGLVGGVLLGPVGLVGGALLGKNNDIHTLSITFKDGKKSLIEINDKIYKDIIKKLY